MKVLGIIPARYASTRFPGKPLVEIDGMSMIQRVYTQAKKCTILDMLVVATDDARIFDHVESFGGKVMMTSAELLTGTDRCAEVLTQLQLDTFFDATNPKPVRGNYPKEKKLFTHVVNIQGDEPLIAPEQIDSLAYFLIEKNYDIATQTYRFTDLETAANPNTVKVVCDTNNKALYFSRAAIPYCREKLAEQYFLKHIGLYAYKAEVLLNLSRLTESYLERTEKLEQLRWLEAGYTIGVTETKFNNLSVDTPSDLEQILKTLKDDKKS